MNLKPWGSCLNPMVLSLQAAGLQPPPGSPDSLQKKEVAALKEQLDKLLTDLEGKSHELQATSQAHADLKGVLKQASKSHCSTESKLNAQINTLNQDLELKTRELQAASRACSELESALRGSAASTCSPEGQLTAALQEALEGSSRQVQALEAELANQGQVLAGKQLELAGKQQRLEGMQGELEGKHAELQAAGEAYAELEDVLARASEEQGASEDKLMGQMTALQHEVKVSIPCLAALLAGDCHRALSAS